LTEEEDKLDDLPPGARKFGFYARSFKPEEIEGLVNAFPYALDDEIEALRVLLRRAFEAAEDEGNLPALLLLLCQATDASDALSRMVHTRLLIEGQPPGKAEAL